MVRGIRRADFATRLKGRLRTLRTRVERRDAVIEVVRQANASLDPQRVATWLVGQAQEWIPAPCWAVVAHDANGQLTVLADVGLTPNLGPSLWAAANWVILHGTEFLSADVACDSRAGSTAFGTVVAFPLICRHQTVGALVGLDPQPSSAAPRLGPSVVLPLRALLEPPAIALRQHLGAAKGRGAVGYR